MMCSKIIKNRLRRRGNASQFSNRRGTNMVITALVLLLVQSVALVFVPQAKRGMYVNSGLNNPGSLCQRLKSNLKATRQEEAHKQHSKHQGDKRSRFLTPNHILHPLYFPYNSTNMQQNEQGLDLLSFPSALLKMKQTLESIASCTNEAQLELALGGSLFSEFKLCPNGEQININGDGQGAAFGDHHEHPPPFTIQIVQNVNHPIDTLCWLHANHPRIEALSPVPNQKPSMIYLSNAERTFEAASVGSALTIDHLDDYNWDVIKNLPDGSGVYGGKRFDPDGDIGEDWIEFGEELWVLPAVELRQERRLGKIDRDDVDDSSYSSTDDSSSMSMLPGEKKGYYHMSLLVHLHFNSAETLLEEARKTLDLIKMLTADVSTSVPCTTLPPILSRGYNPDAQEVFERGINAALNQFEAKSRGHGSLDKVVLASRADLKFGSELKGLDVMKKLKFGGSLGHLFYINPGKDVGKEFLGCTPERLFQVHSSTGAVISEALAGTRPRGSTTEADAELLRDLMHSEKDRKENVITGEFIRGVFESLKEKNMIELKDNGSGADEGNGNFFVRRLRHVQHICQSVDGKMKESSMAVDISRYLLDNLHPTPAVNGFPGKDSLEFIKEHEGISFDRGFYAGPFGFIGSHSSDIIVGIRSALLKKDSKSNSMNNVPPYTMSVYAGAGIVPGSTVQGEWSEIGYKLGVLSSTFTQSPLTLQSLRTPNEAWAIAFVEELIRSGVTQFYVCPGSRSTPLTAALARAMRSNVGVIDCVSTHDERGAAFRALGYARATRRAAAVVTSSGTAVANLYPAIMEASMDGVPLILLTADRPYENRDTGANQAVDQVKVSSDMPFQRPVVAYSVSLF